MVDVRFDVLEAPPLEKFHGAKCEGITNATDFCNYIADGVNLCVEEHSSAWWEFTVCMYSSADPDGDNDNDKNNPLASATTFDEYVAKCARYALRDYKVEDLKACYKGDEGARLRKASAGKTPVFKGPQWVEVAGKEVAAPHGKNLSREEWKKDVIAAACAAYTGEKPKSCGPTQVVV